MRRCGGRRPGAIGRAQSRVAGASRAIGGQQAAREERFLNSKLSLLVVDDQPDLRLLIALTFRGTRYEVQQAANVAEARALCQRCTPDAIILDVMMPGVDGYEFCRELRADAAYDRTVVVLMTAGDQATERVRAAEAGSDFYLPKPFSPAQLPPLIADLLKARRGSA